MFKFVVRWDLDGEAQRKEYDDEAAAKKAKAWLIDRGATNVDIAIKKIEAANPFPIGGK